MNPIIRLHQDYSRYKLTFTGASETTLHGEYHIVAPFIRFYQLDSLEDFSKLKQRDVMNYIFKRNKEKNWAARTIKNNLQALSNFFEYAKDQKIISINPTEGIPRPKPPKNNPRLVEKEDAMQILEWLYFAPFIYDGERERAKAIIATFIFTGVRLSELLNIKNSDINFKNKILRIHNGKGDKDRVIPLNDKLIEILIEYIQCDLKQNNPCSYFFVHITKKSKMGVNSIRALFYRVKKELGIHASAHRLRHTFGNLMVNSGCSIRALQKMMGHSSVETTEIYTHVAVKDTLHEIGKHPFGYSDNLPHKHHKTNKLSDSWY